MARVILSNNETFTVFNSTASVEGGTGTETLLIGGTSSAVTVSQSIERVDLKGNVGDYTYQAAGNQVKVFSNGALVTTITVQDDSNGTQVAFADGSAYLTASSLNAAALGSAAIGTTAVAISSTAVGASFDTAVKSGSTALGGTTNTNQTFTLTTSAASVAEGGAGVVFTLSTTNVPAGTTFAYTVAGSGNAATQTGSGVFTVDSSGKAVSPAYAVPTNSSVGDAGTLQVTLANGKSISGLVTVTDTTPAPVVQTDFTVTAAQIAASNIAAGANAMAVEVGNAGAKSVTLQTDAITSDGGFVINGGGSNIAVTSGAQADTIVVVSSGNNTISTGAGSDAVTVVGTGSNTIDVGAGSDVVTGGSGNDTIIFGSGELGAGDLVSGGSGTDTVVISGDGNVIGGAGATLANVEKLVLNGTKVTIAKASLEALSAVSGSASSSELTVDVASGDTLNLSGTSLAGIKSITADDDVTIVLSAGQIAQIGSIATAAGKNLTVKTDVAGLLALGSKAVAGAGGSVAIQVADTAANIQANAAVIAAAGVTPVLSSAVSVAQAAASLALVSNVSYNLSDTAANLALAPTAIFNRAISISATTDATAAQATAINTTLTAASGFTYAANRVTINVTDTASNIANYYTEATPGDDFDVVTSSGNSTAKEAIAAYGKNAAAIYNIVDSAAALVTDKTNDALDHAQRITVSGSASVDQISQINAASDVDVASGYALSDSFVNLTGSASALIAAAGNVTVSGGNISVANALSVEALANTGVKRYVVEDSIGSLLAANSNVVSSATGVSTSSATVTAAQANALVAKYGSTKVSDTSFVIEDSLANLLTLTAVAVAVAQASNGVTVSSGTATVSQLVQLNTLVGTKLNKATVAVSDTAENLVSGVGVTATLELLDDVLAAVGTVSLSGTATIAQAVTVNDKLGGTDEFELANTFAISDTAAHLVSAASGSVGAANVLGDAASVVVTTATSIANVTTINAAAGLTLGTTLKYSLSDSASNILAGGATVAGATAVSATDAAVSYADAESLAGLTNFDDSYSINDEVANLFDKVSDDQKAILDAAKSVTLTDTVANLEGANGIVAIGLSTTDTVVVSDELAKLAASRTAGTAVANADKIIISDLNLGVGDAAAVNALSALKSTEYSIADAFEDIATALADTGSGGANAAGAVTTFLNRSSTVSVDSGAISVSNFNALDAATTASIRADITDTIAHLTATSGAAALANVIAAEGTLSISDTVGTVAQIVVLDEAGASVTDLSVVDTAAHLSAMDSALLASLDGATVSDNGSVTQNVEALTRIYSDDGSQYGNYSVVDTAANIADAIAAIPGLVNYATAVTATGNATYTQADVLANATTFGTPIRYSVTVAAADNLVAGPALNSAVNVSASNAQSVSDASILNAATNSGSTSYSISDLAANLAASADVAGIEAATGTVTASSVDNAALAATIAGFAKAVVYSVSYTAAEVSGASSAARNEAVNVTVTDTATVAQANTVMASTNSGTTTIATVSGTAALVKTLAIGANDVVTSVTVTDTTSGSDAAAIVALDTGANITNTFFSAISGSATEVAALGNAVLAAETTVTVTPAMTVAQYNTLAAAITIGNVDSYSLQDSFTNLMVDTNTDGTVNANSAIAGATIVTLTDSALTVAQADAIDGINTGKVVYSIRDADAQIVAALDGSVPSTQTALLAAASVYSADGLLLDIQRTGIGSTYVISGTKSEIDSLSSVLKASQVAYEVSVANLEANPSFYATRAANQHITVIDTVAQLTGGNALLAAAEHIVVTDAATVAQATTIRALSSLDNEVVFSLTDTAANLASAAGGSSIVDAAVNVTATTAATEAQAEFIADEGNSGSVSYSIVSLDTAVTTTDFGSLAATNAYENATNITITGTTGITSAQADILLGKANSGTTTIAKVTGNSASLAALSVGANDVITTVTPSDAAKVAQVLAMQARAGSISAYSLSDTAANLAAASASVLNGATNITASGNATVAQATVIDAATNSGTVTLNIVDSAANVLAASATVLANDSTIEITDTPVTAGVATQLRALDAANTGITIAKVSGDVGVFTIADTQANVIAAANSAAVGASTDVRITGTLTVAQGVAVEAASVADEAPAYKLTDTYTNLVINHSGSASLNLSSVDLAVSNNLNVAQAKVIAGYSANSVSVNIVDTSANVFASAVNDAVTGALSVKLSNAASVEQAAVLTNGTIQLSGGYAISDSAANVFSAWNTANAADAGDRGLLEGATSITLTTAATVPQALGGAANQTDDSEARGLAKISGLNYSITDTVANMLVGLGQTNDASGITGATALNASDNSAMTVEDALLLTSLTNFKGHDDDANGTTAGVYYIDDGFVAIQAADTAFINSARTVTAIGTDDADVIDLSMHTKGIVIVGGDGNDTIVGTSGGDTLVFTSLTGSDTITGGVGLDVLTLGDGVDRVVFASGDAGRGTGLSLSNYTDKDTAMSDGLNVGDTVTGPERITDFSNTDGSGESIVLGNVSITAFVNTGRVQDDTASIVQGTYDATTGIFTVGAGRTTGEDSLMLWDSDETTGLEIEAVVLVGVNATEANYFAAASGVLTM